MVGSLVLSKIIKFKHKVRKNKMHSKETKELHFDHYNNLCRICLSQGTIPIFGNAYREDISETVNLFGNIQVHIEDEYPKLLCASCHRLLLNARLFRNTAQRTDRVLKQSKINIDTETYDKPNTPVETSIDYEEYDKKSFYDDPNSTEIKTTEYQTETKMANETEQVKRTCEICQKTFTLRYYKLHMKIHIKKDIPFMCEICGKKFLMKGHLTRHRQVHFNDLPFKCTVCPYRGRFLENLRSHMKTHTGEKSFQCAHCPSKFVNKSNLNQHMWTHKTEKEFKCTCGKGYHTKKHLDDHFKVDHAGIKEHICNLCGKEFGYRKQMMQHQRGVHKRQKFQSGRIPLYLQVESSDCNGFDKFPSSVNL